MIVKTILHLKYNQRFVLSIKLYNFFVWAGKTSSSLSKEALFTLHVIHASLFIMKKLHTQFQYLCCEQLDQLST